MAVVATAATAPVLLAAVVAALDVDWPATPLDELLALVVVGVSDAVVGVSVAVVGVSDAVVGVSDAVVGVSVAVVGVSDGVQSFDGVGDCVCQLGCTPVCVVEWLPVFAAATGDALAAGARLNTISVVPAAMATAAAPSANRDFARNRSLRREVLLWIRGSFTIFPPNTPGP